MGITGADLCAVSILLRTVLGHLMFQEGLLQLLVRNFAGCCATGLWALLRKQLPFCSPFPPKPQTVDILGHSTPEIKEEITVALGV